MAREANVVVADGPFAKQLHRRLEQAMVFESKHIAAAQFATRPRYQRALDWMAYGLMRSVLFLTGKRY
jgi:cardiolipin synthase